MFDIKSITIYEECKYRKNLDADTYTFGDSGLRDFFGRKITLHTLVGKNGSGKSSLLDIVFRMVNNVGAVMCKQEIREAADRIRYVRHIFADLEYDNGEIYKLCVRDTLLWIENGHDVYWLSDGNLKSKAEDVDVEFCYGQLMRRYGDAHIHDYSDMNPLERKKDIANMLFFTIATNYSMVGFQAADYEDEDSLEWEDEIFVVTDDHKYVVSDDGKFVVASDWVARKNWITGLFHKNDGYMCPIVLNPYRNGGEIKVDNEAALTESRLSALLISEHMDKHPLVEAFLLDRISYGLKSDFYKRLPQNIWKRRTRKRTIDIVDTNQMSEMQSTGLPYCNSAVFPNQEEIAIRCGLLPHFIIGYAVGRNFYVNPAIFNAIDRMHEIGTFIEKCSYMRRIQLHGLVDNQENFEEFCQRTNFKKYFTFDGDDYTT